MNKWNPIGTIPRDGHEVELFSPSEGVDVGYWYSFDEPNWAAENPWWSPFPGVDDLTGDFSTNKGSGDYTHWREMEKQA